MVLGVASVEVQGASPGDETSAHTNGSDLLGILGETVPGGLHAGLLPLSDATSHLLPGGGLRPGALVHVSGGAGATTMALAMVAGPCRAGAWVGCVGFPELGWEAAGEVGLPLQRVVAVEIPGDARTPFRTKAMAAMVDAFELVVCGPGAVVTTSTARRLRARARERGSVLVQVSGRNFDGGARSSVVPRPEGDVSLRVLGTEWEGLGRGWGYLSRRTTLVEVSGRGPLGRPRRCEVTFGSSGSAEGGPSRVRPSGADPSGAAFGDLFPRAG